jgi:hypothetical protein
MQSKIFTIRFSQEQFERLSNDAVKCSMSLGELIRYRIGFESKSNTRQIIFLLNKTSNNINQIAKGLNTANLSGRLHHLAYTQALARLSILQNDFKLFYDLIKQGKIENAD